MSSSPGNGYVEQYENYKSKEKDVYNAIFPERSWKTSSLRDQLRELEKAVPSLTQTRRSSIAKDLEQVGKDREEFASTFFSHQPKGRRYRHDWYHTTFLKRCIGILDPSKIKTAEAAGSQRAEILQQMSSEEEYFSELASVTKETFRPTPDMEAAAVPVTSTEEEEEPTTPLTEEAEAVNLPSTIEADADEKAEILEPELLDKTGDEVSFLCFLEDLERLVDKAVGLWRRVATGHLRLATAANLTFSITRTIRSVVHAESVLNESWFMNNEGLVVTYQNLEYSFWIELQQGGQTFEDNICRLFNPILDADLKDHNYVSAARMLLEPIKEGRLKGPHKKDLSGSLEIATTAVILNRCDRLSLDIDVVRKSVHLRIDDWEALAQYANIHPTQKAFVGLATCLSMVPSFRKWAAACDIALGFGVLMSWLEIDIVRLKRIFICENSALQCFAYICEIDRIQNKRPTSLSIELDTLFNDPRVVPFLFQRGRPKILRDCTNGVDQWANPKSVSQSTAHSLQVRDKPTVSQQISWGDGSVKRHTSQQLNERTLEQHLEWELDFTDPVHFERCLIDAVRSVVKIREGPVNSTSVYFYLEKQVLWQPKKQRQLLNMFIENWKTKVGDKHGASRLAPH